MGEIKYSPKDLRNRIIAENHDSIIGGHRGVNKTLKRIQQKFQWENMQNDIIEFIQHNLPCQLKRLNRVKTRQPMMTTTTPSTAMDKIAMDIVGPLKRTTAGNEYISTIQDDLTKFALALPIPDITAKTVADFFIRHFICYFGAPRLVLIHEGSNLLSQFSKRIAKRFRIRQMDTRAYRSSSNPVEPFHQPLVQGGSRRQ